MKPSSPGPVPRSGLHFQHAARSGLGRVTAAGWMTHGGMDGWRDLGQYAVALVVDGHGSYADANDLQLKISPGSLIMVFPGLRHYYHPLPGTRWTEYYLVFDGPVFALWEELRMVDRRNPVHRVPGPDHWARQLETVAGPSGQLGMDPPMFEVCRLQSVLAHLLWQGTGRAAAEDDLDWLVRARALLESALFAGVPIDELAGRMGLGTPAFRKKFARLMGESPAHYRSARMIDRACEIMQSTSLRDKEIAEQLGFCDEYYFSRRFRQVTGKSPREFRATLPNQVSSEG